MDLSGKVCVVTGASSGIGRRTALTLADAGAKVCVAARREGRLQTILEECSGEGHSYVMVDVRRRDDVQALADHVESTYGRCDVLINNAGLGGEHIRLGERGAVSDLENVMRTNFFGAVLCTAAFLPLLQRSAPAHVVNVASVAGRIALGGTAAYNASKFALVGWSEALGYELADLGIAVSSVEPGLIPTEGFSQSELKDHRVLRYVLGSEGQVAAAIEDVILHSAPQRTVPRWYYLVQVPRVLTPSLYRYVLRKVMKKYGRHALSV
jgi:NAD(P)-dependent dehydrogenase (short-subunit alcohol dehydrogenase family)